MPLKLNGSSSGYISIDAPAVAGTTSLTFPATNGSIIVANSTGSVSISNTLVVSGTSTHTGAATFSNTVTFSSDIVPATSYKRNRIINGNMLIDQRNAGASVTPTDGQYTVDRWGSRLSQASKYSVQQNAGSVTLPAGFANYLGVTSLSSYSVISTDYFSQQYRIEGYNTADLAWGTANAKTITLSFQVYSSLTGTFGGSVGNGAGNRCYVFSYSIPTANTWTTISITIAGDTSGTWLTTNGIGMYVTFGIGCGTSNSSTAGSWGSTFYSSVTGAVSVVGTSGATFYITGVQLEVGTKATPYEMQIYSDQLAQCQRYYSRNVQNAMWGAFESSTSFLGLTRFPVTMRAAPTVSRTGTTQLTSIVGTISDNGSWNYTGSNVNGGAIAFAPSSGTYTVGLPAQVTTDTVTFSAEL